MASFMNHGVDSKIHMESHSGSGGDVPGGPPALPQLDLGKLNGGGGRAGGLSGNRRPSLTSGAYTARQAGPDNSARGTHRRGSMTERAMKGSMTDRRASRTTIGGGGDGFGYPNQGSGSGSQAPQLSTAVVGSGFPDLPAVDGKNNRMPGGSRRLSISRTGGSARRRSSVGVNGIPQRGIFSGEQQHSVATNNNSGSNNSNNNNNNNNNNGSNNPPSSSSSSGDPQPLNLSSSAAPSGSFQPHPPTFSHTSSLKSSPRSNLTSSYSRDEGLSQSAASEKATTISRMGGRQGSTRSIMTNGSIRGISRRVSMPHPPASISEINEQASSSGSQAHLSSSTSTTSASFLSKQSPFGQTAPALTSPNILSSKNTPPTSRRPKPPTSGGTTRTQRASGVPPASAAAAKGLSRAGSTQSRSGFDMGMALNANAALKLYMKSLSTHERTEILEYSQVYFTGHHANKVRDHSASPNFGYDDDRGDYRIVQHDHIAYRFEVLEILGKGSFGQVVKAYDYKNKLHTAIKVIRNKKRFHQQAQVEVRLLEHLRKHDPDDAYNCIRMNGYFHFRGHLCITFELLSLNLYDFIKQNKFAGFTLGLIRRFAIQILNALKFLHHHRIVHCDLKPENILLKTPNKSGIKVIDFGSSCFDSQSMYTYIQSRFYRSPEVILGLGYSMPIDMWSLGCILAELHTGYPLFPGENEVEQLLAIMEIQGLPPRRMVEESKRSKVFFDGAGNPKIVANSRGKKRRPNTKDLATVLRTHDSKFLSFMNACLAWDPKERLTPEEGLSHPWILEAISSTRTSAGPTRGRQSSGQSSQAHGQSGNHLPSIA